MNKPEWLKVGQWIEFAFAVGRIVDIAESPARIMLLVESPKMAWRNHRPEWIEFNPELVKVADLGKIKQEFDTAHRQLQRMTAELNRLESALVS